MTLVLMAPRCIVEEAFKQFLPQEVELDLEVLRSTGIYIWRMTAFRKVC